MRDIIDYQKAYQELPFEKYQALYRRKKVIELLQQYSHKVVLEIGCGMQPLFTEDIDVEKWIVVEPGNLFYKNAINLCRENGKILCLNDYFENCVSTIKQLDVRIDYIICSCLLHELEEPKEFLKKIRDICDKETVVHVSVPNALSLHRLLAVCMKLIPDVYQKSETQSLMQQSSTVYDKGKLETLCKLCGFEVLRFGTYFIKPFTHSQMQMCLDKHIFNEDLLDGLNQLISYIPDYGSEIFIQLKVDNNLL